MSDRPAKPIKLVALDVDGTLISSKLDVSPAVHDRLAKAKAAGIITTIVTGRMFAAAQPFAAKLGIDGPIVCYQGAAIYVASSGERISHVPLSLATGKLLFERAAADGVRALGYLNDRLYTEGVDQYLRFYTELSKTEATIVPSLVELFAKEPTTKIVCVLEPERAGAYADELRAFIGHDAYVTRSNPEYVESLNPDVDKGRALAEVARFYGVGLDETMAVGDSWNDVPLLRAAGFGVAMGSAPAELRAESQAVVADVFHDGVAEAFDRFVL